MEFGRSETFAEWRARQPGGRTVLQSIADAPQPLSLDPAVVERLQLAIAAARSDDRAGAAAELRQITATYPTVVAAWSWLAFATDDPLERVGSMQRVAELDPANLKAREWLRRNGFPTSQDQQELDATAAQLADGGRASARTPVRKALEPPREKSESRKFEENDAVPDDSGAWLGSHLDRRQRRVDSTDRMTPANWVQTDEGREDSGRLTDEDSRELSAAEILGDLDEVVDPVATSAAIPASGTTGRELSASELLGDLGVFDQPGAGQPVAAPEVDSAEAGSLDLSEVDFTPLPRSASAPDFRTLLADEERTDASSEPVLGRPVPPGRESGPSFEPVDASPIETGPSVTPPGREATAEPLLSSEHAEPKLREPSVVPERPVRPFRVLVAEPDAAQAHLLRIAFGHLGCEVTLSTDEAGALQAATSSQPDLVVTAEKLGGSDGITLCKTLKTLPETAGVPVVLHTENGGMMMRSRAKRAGVDELLVGPLTPEALQELHQRMSSAL